MAVFNGGMLYCKGLLMHACASSAASERRLSRENPSGLQMHGRRSCWKPSQASYFKEAFSFPEALQAADASSEAFHPSTVFRDEAKGIVCYRTSTGEITCEGFDEGPHFDPPSQYLRLQFPRQLVSAKAQYDEDYVNGAGI